MHPIIEKILALKTSWIFTKKSTSKPHTSLVINATLVSCRKYIKTDHDNLWQD